MAVTRQRMETTESTATHCPYCALQCGMKLTRRGDAVSTEVIVNGNESFPVNGGALCIKGWTSGELLDHPERLLRPLKRNARGALGVEPRVESEHPKMGPMVTALAEYFNSHQQALTERIE